MNDEQQQNEALQPEEIEPANLPLEEPQALEASAEAGLDPTDLDMDELFAELLSGEEALAVEAAAPAELIDVAVPVETLEAAAETAIEPVEMPDVLEAPPEPMAVEPVVDAVAVEASSEAPIEPQSEAVIEASPEALPEELIEAVPEPDFPALEMAAEPVVLELETASAAESVEEPSGIDWLEAEAQVPQPEELSLAPEAAETAEPAPEFDGSDAMLQELLAEESNGWPESAEALEAAASFPEFAAPPPAERVTERETDRSSPPLEDLISGIDAQLETAVPAAAPVEQPATIHKQFSQLDDYVVFCLSGGDYALPVRDVAEIGRVPTVTKVPNVPEFVRGITNLRGEIVPVLNLPQLLGLQETALTARGRVLFLQARDQVAASGLLVDEVKGIQRIPSQQLEHVTGLVDDKVTSVLRGVHGRGDRLLNVLDLEQVFRLEEFQRFERR